MVNTTRPYCPDCRRRHQRSSDTATPPPPDSSINGRCSEVSQPSLAEKRFFNHGLPSNPRLVGRVSSAITTWKPLREQYQDHVARHQDLGYFESGKKVLFCIGNHPILEKWDGIQESILSCISTLPWNAVDVFRIGTLENKPVVVWIAVDHDASSWQLVLDSLLGCKEILDGVGLHDVDVQIRLAKLTHLANGLIPPRTETDFNLRLHRHTQPLSTGVGTSIFPYALPGWSGSVGMYLRPTTKLDGEAECPTWALTCRHVVLPGDLNVDNEEFPYEDDNDTRIVGFGSQELVDSALAAAHQEKQLQVELIPTYTAERHRESATKFLQVVNETISDLQKIWKPELRSFGKLLFAPSISVVKTGNFKWLRDWALVEVDTDQCPKDNLPANVADLRSRVRLDTLNNFEPYGVSSCSFVPPPNGLLQLSGVLSIGEMYRPPHMDNGIGGHVVGKRGAKTGMTWGMASEIRSITRQCLPNGERLETSEWAVVVLPNISNNAFSARGDSGSVLFTVNGRVAGFLTRGSDALSGAKTDVTYATPIEFVLQDVCKTLGREVNLI